MDTQSFRDDLAAKSAEKRKLKFQQFKKRKALERVTARKPTEAEALLAVKNAIQALTDLILAQGKSGPGKFTVEERDMNGKIKSFKVE